MNRLARTALLSLTTLVALAACGTAPAPQSAAGEGSNASQAAPSGKQLSFVFVTHDLGAGIFAPVRRGMEDACKQINATCEFIGPQTYDTAQQVALIEAAIAKKPDGIATTRPEPGTYDNVIKKALDAGIVVTAFNTNDPTADEGLPVPFVGQNFTNYGVVWARETMKALPEGGKIAVTDCCLGHYALEERIRSFKETIEKEGGGKWIVDDVINTSADEQKIFSAIEAYYQANPDVKAIFGVDYYAGIIAQFIKNNKLEGKLVTGGSDLAPGMVEGLKGKYAAFGLGQNPYLQGYYPVMMMHQQIVYGIRPITIDTGTDVVTPDNITQYNAEYR